MSYQAEYIWIDGTEPEPLMRSKTRIVKDGKEPEIWGFDGSSTNQAPGSNSDCVLRPVYTVPDPIRGGDNVLVLCEVELTDFTPHPTNTRAKARLVAEKYADQAPHFGIEQEYTFFQNGRPLGWPAVGYPEPQGPYYCGVGGEKMVGRAIIEKHTQACLDAGLAIEGTNAEVMMAQWEFQIGVLPPPAIGDQMWVARWLLHRIAEDFNVTVCEALGTRVSEHVEHYGYGIKDRLTGAHETAPWHTYSWGASDRGASVRIPWAVEKAKKGWIEDRRPNANMDPYIVTALIVDTCCSALAGEKPVLFVPEQAEVVTPASVSV